MNLNRCTLLGSVVDAPQVRSAGSSEVMALRVATVESWKDRASGERRERTDYHTVEVWTPDLIEEGRASLGPGSLVFVEGMLKTQKWTDKTGQDRWQTVVSVRPYSGTLAIFGSRSGGSSQAPKRAPRRSQADEMWEDVMGTDSPF